MLRLSFDSISAVLHSSTDQIGDEIAYRTSPYVLKILKIELSVCEISIHPSNLFIDYFFSNHAFNVRGMGLRNLR